MERLVKTIEEKDRMFLYCKLESADIDIDGNIHLVLSKDSVYPTSTEVVKVLRKYFEKKDIILIFEFLLRDPLLFEKLTRKE